MVEQVTVDDERYELNGKTVRIVYVGHGSCACHPDMAIAHTYGTETKAAEVFSKAVKGAIAMVRDA